MKVKPEQQEIWDSILEANQDIYGLSINHAIGMVGNRLDKDDSPKQALESLDHADLTGFMRGCVAKAIGQFHIRGDEFKKYWNIKCGGTGEERGTINPAILTIK